MSSLNYSSPTKEEVCWTLKDGVWLNIVVKEENEEEDVTVEKVESEAVQVKEEENDVPVKEEKEFFMVKEEENEVPANEMKHVENMTEKKVKGADLRMKTGKITVTLEEEEVAGGRISTRERRDYPGSTGDPQQHQGPDKDNSILPLPYFPESLGRVSVSRTLLLGLKRVSVRLVDCRKPLGLNDNTRGGGDLTHQG
ncbi:uncharacterized protein LOC114839784 isoform X3 [Esox lucius]|nr:uncharacterized protein LOC114839784 isoform X3 [Esox lucius]